MRVWMHEEGVEMECRADEARFDREEAVITSISGWDRSRSGPTSKNEKGIHEVLRDARHGSSFHESNNLVQDGQSEMLFETVARGLIFRMDGLVFLASGSPSHFLYEC